jgi:polysaccharide pyruvyl transferase WcaK-like protein
VGLNTLRAAGDTRSAIEAVIALRRADALVVRDEPSRTFVEMNGFTATVSPDMVHAISLRFPELGNTDGAGDDPYFLFQANGYLIQKNGPEAIAKALAQVARATGWRPMLFLAGTARHHDRLDQYDAVMTELRAIDATLRPMLIETRLPLELAGWIAKSRLWIGSSLHGRIISGSFGLPRVSLENTKVAAYSQTWDTEFPVNVEFADLPAAVDAAIGAAGANSNRVASRELAELADAMTKRLVKEHM